MSRPIDPPDDITQRWFETVSGTAKTAARRRGQETYPGHMTLVEGIIWWWEHEIRPGLNEPKKDDDATKSTPDSSI